MRLPLQLVLVSPGGDQCLLPKQCNVKKWLEVEIWMEIITVICVKRNLKYALYLVTYIMVFIGNYFMSRHKITVMVSFIVELKFSCQKLIH